MSYIIITDDLKQRQEWARQFKHLMPEIAFFGLPDQTPTSFNVGLLAENTALSATMINNLKMDNGYLAKSNHQIEEFLKMLDAKKVLDGKIKKFVG